MRKKLLKLLPLCLFSVPVLVGNIATAQDTTLRTRTNSQNFSSNSAWEFYDDNYGSWFTAPAGVVPSPNKNIIIRDGHSITSNSDNIVVKSLTVGEGGGAIATAELTDDAVTSVHILDPGQLVFIPTPIFVNGGQTPNSIAATATVKSVKVTGVSINSAGAGYTEATVTFSNPPAGGTTATGIVEITGNMITGVTITNPGSGYKTIPSVTIDGDGDGVSITAKIGIEAITITNGGSGYTTSPTIHLGTQFQVGNATTGRTVTVNNDVVFNRGAVILSGGGNNSTVAETLIIGGSLSAATPVSFFSSIPTSTQSTSVRFTKEGEANITGAGAVTFRNITVGASTILKVANTINLAGTIGLNTTGTIDASNGGVRFVTYPNYPAFTPFSQTIENNTFSPATIANLEIANSAGVTLNQNLTVSNNLRLDTGILNIPTATLLQLNSTNDVAGNFGPSTFINTIADATSGAIGSVQINGIAGSLTRMLPLGNNGNYLPIAIAPDETSTFTASVLSKLTDNGMPNGNITTDKKNYVDAVFMLNRTTGNGSAKISVCFPSNLKGSGLAGILNNQLGLAAFSGNTWTPVKGSGDNTKNIAIADFSSFSPLRVEYNANSSVLPIKTGDLTATKVNDKTVLSWKVYTEENASSYVIERSFNGVTFTAIGSVNATGNAAYSITDATPAFSKNFYRLKSVEKNNSSTYSKVLMVDFSKLSAALTVSPNPVSHSTFKVKFDGMKTGKVAVKLINNNGQMVLDEPVNFNGSKENQVVNLPANIAKGIYQLIISDGLTSKTTSVIIQ